MEEETLPGISLLLAAYNEATPIGDVVRTLRQSLEEYGGEYEILVIDDGSEDGTGTIAAEAGAKVISHPANKGYGASLKTGARRAHYPLLVFFDVDGQHDPSDVAKVVEEMARGEFDMVVGARGAGSHVSLSRAPGKKLLAWVANYLAETKIPDLNSGLRAVRRDVFFEFIHILPNQFSLTSTLTLALMKAGYTVAYVPIVVRRRSGRPSNVRIFRDGFKAFMLIVNTIVLFNPNKVFVPASIVLFLVGSLYALYTIVTDFNIGSGALLTIITSMIVFFFGIIADQLSSMRRERR
jgi:glycosyltransferase involved in cell wall biosynthesis